MLKVRVLFGLIIHDVRRIIKEIKKVYGDDAVVDYYGATDTDARSKNIKKFQTDPNCRFFVGTTHTGGYGITLTAGSNMIYFSNGYDLEKRQQSEARIDRNGQTRKMTYIDIMSQDTIDERIVKVYVIKLILLIQLWMKTLESGFKTNSSNTSLIIEVQQPPLLLIMPNRSCYLTAQIVNTIMHMFYIFFDTMYP